LEILDVFFIYLKFDIFEILWLVNFESLGLDVVWRVRPLERLYETK